ncbi:MAG: hypothetical protein IT374_06555 [Polyangiaceae bacterium]|nr:hypothetical protein [Polyangiaceae bacterium]
MALDAIPPRELTPALRKAIGLPARAARYRWSFAALTVGAVAVPLLLAGLPKVLGLFAFVALVGLPLGLWIERRDAAAKEELFRHGALGWATVLEVEPGGDSNKDRPVRLELWVEGAAVQTTVRGAPLARRGLEPGADIRVIYAADDPRRCLIVERGARPVVDAVFDD